MFVRSFDDAADPPSRLIPHDRLRHTDRRGDLGVHRAHQFLLSARHDRLHDRRAAADLRSHVPGVPRRLSPGCIGANDRDRRCRPDDSRSASTGPPRRPVRPWCSTSTAAASSSAASTAMTISAPSCAHEPATRSSRSTTGWRRSTCIPPLSTMRWRHSNGRRTPTRIRSCLPATRPAAISPRRSATRRAAIDAHRSARC